MKVAFIHDWFNDVGGAEKVAREILVCYPEADVFSIIDFYDEAKRKKYLLGKKATTSFIQRIPFSKKYYRFLFPLFPGAVEGFNLSEYNLIISSSSSVAKGIRKNPNQLHICYCHSPVRYAWDLRADYLKVITNPFTREVFDFFLQRLKEWDLKSNARVDYFVANSNYVKARIHTNYEREAQVIYPPVDINSFTLTQQKQDYYFTVSRLVSYKKTENIVRAFAKFPHLKLQVAGKGPNMNRLKKMSPPNVSILGYLPSEELREKIKYAKAFIANANEDFGITVVEAQSCATPIIVPYLGGYKETVNEKTGLFFKSQDQKEIENAIELFEANTQSFKQQDFLANVQRFDKSRFHQEFKRFVETKCSIFFAE